MFEVMFSGSYDCLSVVCELIISAAEIKVQRECWGEL